VKALKKPIKGEGLEREDEVRIWERQLLANTKRIKGNGADGRSSPGKQINKKAGWHGDENKGAVTQTFLS